MSSIKLDTNKNNYLNKEFQQAAEEDAAEFENSIPHIQDDSGHFDSDE